MFTLTDFSLAQNPTLFSHSTLFALLKHYVAEMPFAQVFALVILVTFFHQVALFSWY